MAAKKKSARKKTATKKKAAVKKKTATKKKAQSNSATAARSSKKKTTAKKKVATTTKKTASKKAAAKKTASKKTTQKKAAAKKKTAAKTSSGKPAKKKAAAAPPTKKKTATKKPAADKKPVSKKTMAKATSSASRKRARTPEEVRPGFTPYKEKKGEEYMNDAQAEHFRNLLLDWKQELMEEVDRTVHHMQDEVANYPDPNDRATVEEEFALELRTRDRERKLIKKINESLTDIDSGDYGFCEVCGVEIGIRRLEARPTATLCIDCKTLDEIKERQYG
ncbi:RNA polymerase-binding protein DksA [Methylohalomonas lacus]|nr:RNA polymerase-binding protein DksA [Methylohalomonas lacus]